MVGIELATLHSISGRQGAQMVAGGERVARSALTPLTARAGHFRGVYGVEAHRSAVMAAADGVAVVVIRRKAGEETGRFLIAEFGARQDGRLGASDDASGQGGDHRACADERLQRWRQIAYFRSRLGRCGTYCLPSFSAFHGSPKAFGEGVSTSFAKATRTAERSRLCSATLNRLSLAAVVIPMIGVFLRLRLIISGR